MNNFRRLFLSAVSIISPAAILLAPSLLFAAGGGGGDIDLKDALVWDVGLKALNVFVLGFFLIKVLAKPLANFLNARAEGIRSELDKAKAGRLEAEERLRRFQEKAAGLDLELENLRKQTCDDIDREQKLLFQEATQAAEHIRKHTRDTIRQEVAKAREDLHREAALLATKIAEEIISERINTDDHDRLVNVYLKDMEAMK